MNGSAVTNAVVKTGDTSLSFFSTAGAISIDLDAPATLSSLGCMASSLVSNTATTCTVMLSRAVMSSVTISLSSDVGSILISGAFSVPVGADSATFTAAVGAVTSGQTATLTAHLAGTSKSFLLSLATPPALIALQCSDSSLAANSTTTCSARLSRAAVVGTVISLSGNVGSILIPGSVSVPTGEDSATFTAAVGAITSDQTATLTAYLAGTSKTFVLSLATPPALIAFQCSDSSLAANSTTTCSARLSKGAVVDTMISLSSNAGSIVIPGSVSVPPSADSANFTAASGAITSGQTATLTASLAGNSKSVVASPLGGCSTFKANNVWKPRMGVKLPLDLHSNQYVSSIGMSSCLHPDFSATGGGLPLRSCKLLATASPGDIRPGNAGERSGALSRSTECPYRRRCGQLQ